MILVAGATGHLGSLVVRLLRHRGLPVRILVRTRSPQPEAVAALEAAGAQPVYGDLKDRPSLDAACAGVETVITTATSGSRGGADTIESVDRAGNRNLVEAAAAAGVRRFVFTSTLGADPDSPVPMFAAKGETEALLRRGAMSWTVLRPNAMLDVFVPMVAGPALAGRDVVQVGSGQRRHSMVAARDVAAYAVAALDRAAAERATLTVGGPEPVSWRDIIAAVGRELGRELPVRVFRPGEPVPGLPGIAARMLAAIDTFDSPLDMRATAAEYGVTPTTLAEVAHEVVTAARRHPLPTG